MSTYTKKWGDRGQNINRMPVWGIRAVVTKTSVKLNTKVSQYLNTLGTSTSNTDRNMTHNLRFKKWGETWGACPPVLSPVHPVIDAHENTSLRSENQFGFDSCGPGLRTLCLFLLF